MILQGEQVLALAHYLLKFVQVCGLVNCKVKA